MRKRQVQQALQLGPATCLTWVVDERQLINYAPLYSGEDSIFKTEMHYIGSC